MSNSIPTSPASSERRILGRGLASLLSEVATSFEEGPSELRGAQVKYMPIRQITFNSGQPRKLIEQDALMDLAASIKEHGILQPIIVRKFGPDDQYQIVAGERRYQAAKQIGLSEVPVLIKELDDIAAFEIAVIENIQRQDITSLEEAESYHKLIAEYCHTQESLSKRLGKSRSHISNTMRLLKLPPEVRSLLANGLISPGHARAIVNSENALELADLIVRKGLTVRDVEHLVRNDSSSTLTPNQRARAADAIVERDQDIAQTEKMLRETLGMDVIIKQGKDNRYALTIKCPDLEKLDMVIAKLSDSSFELDD